MLSVLSRSAALRPALVRAFTTSSFRCLAAAASGPSGGSNQSEAFKRAQEAYRAVERQQQAARAAASAGSRGAPAGRRGAPVEEEVDEDEEEEDEYADDEYDDDQDYDENESAYPEVAMVTQPAPAWRATALMPSVGDAPGEFKQISSDDFLGKWTVLFFYPLDFTFVCPTEIRAFSDRISEFEKLDVSVVAASVDSEYSHLAWTQQPKTSGGLGPMKIPILADITKSISKSYGVLLEDQGIALRGLFIIDPKGILRQSTVNDLPIGRSVDETLRLLQAFQYHEKNGEVCPAGWTPGKEAMSADAAGLKKYFGKK